MNIPIDFYLLSRYTISIDRKKLLPSILMIFLLATFSFAPYLIAAVCIILLSNEIVCALIDHDDSE